MAELKEGTKNDSGKPRFDLIPPDFMWLMADLLAMGAKKYADRNWEQGIQFGRVFAALQRHAWKFWAGEEFDPEDGQRHLISVAWCAMVLLHYSLNDLKYKEFDDRVKGDFRPWSAKSIVDSLDEIDKLLDEVDGDPANADLDIAEVIEKAKEIQNREERERKNNGIVYYCSYPGCNNPVGPQHTIFEKVYCMLHGLGSVPYGSITGRGPMTP